MAFSVIQSLYHFFLSFSRDFFLLLLSYVVYHLGESYRDKKDERDLLILRLSALIEECNLNTSPGIGIAKLPFVLDGTKSFLYNTPGAASFPELIKLGIALLVKANLHNSCGGDRSITFQGEKISASSMKLEFAKYSELCRHALNTLISKSFMNHMARFQKTFLRTSLQKVRAVISILTQ